MACEVAAIGGASYRRTGPCLLCCRGSALTRSSSISSAHEGRVRVGAMTRLKRSFTRAGNHIGVWMYRTLKGRLSSGSKDVHVLMITTPGRRTGIPRSTCVRYLETPAGFAVWGTGSGSRRDPDWFQNLREAPTVRVQVRERQFVARPHELHGEERDAMWSDLIEVQAPRVSRYARKAGRTIPVAVLEPVQV